MPRKRAIMNRATIPIPAAMNKLETDYAVHLTLRHRDGEIRGYVYEGVKLRLADRTWYTPDFLVWMADGSLELHEVKGGFIRDDAMVKFKCTAELFPMFRFVMVQYKKAKGWRILLET